jgi:hypothetical protein
MDAPNDHLKPEISDNTQTGCRRWSFREGWQRRSAACESGAVPGARIRPYGGVRRVVAGSRGATGAAELALGEVWYNCAKRPISSWGSARRTGYGTGMPCVKESSSGSAGSRNIGCWRLGSQ